MYLGQESDTLVYKKTTKDIANSICALLNTKGGIIVLGCDNKGQAIGISNKNMVDKRISSILTPNIKGNNIDEHVSFSWVNENEKDVLIIFVKDLSKETENRDYFSIGEKIFRRCGCRNINDTKKINQQKTEIFAIEPGFDKHYFKIGKYAKSNYFYRYMKLDTAILCLKNKSIRFDEPCHWLDKFDGRLYKAKILGNQCSKDNPITFACCVTNKMSNEAAWKIYSYGATGLGAHCVQFKINRKNFRNELINGVKSINAQNGIQYDLYEGVVQYKYDKDLKNIHTTINGKNNYQIEIGDKIFYQGKFGLDVYLNLLLLKRDLFQHEQEIRFFLIPQSNPQLQKGKCKPMDLEINWSNVIEEVRVDSTCSKLEKQILEDTLLNFGDLGNLVTDTTIIDKLKPRNYYVYGSPADGRIISI